jgi:hypothetical protein
MQLHVEELSLCKALLLSLSALPPPPPSLQPAGSTERRCSAQQTSPLSEPAPVTSWCEELTRVVRPLTSRATGPR